MNFLDADTTFKRVDPGNPDPAGKSGSAGPSQQSSLDGQSGSAGATSIYERDNDSRWIGFPGLFGGYVNALVLKACALEVNDTARTPRSLTVHFLRPFPAGRMRIEVHVERSGASVTVLSARLICEGKLCGLATVSFAKERESVGWVDVCMPKVEPFDASRPQSGELQLPYRDNLEMWDVFGINDGGKMGAGGAGSGSFAPTGSVRSGGWVRPKGEGRIDEGFLSAVADGFTPVIYRRLAELDEESMGVMAGTMEFTAYFRSSPSVLKKGEPVLVALSTASSLHGYVDEDCTVWSPQGELLLQSRQMRFMHTLSGFKQSQNSSYVSQASSRDSSQDSSDKPPQVRLMQ